MQAVTEDRAPLPSRTRTSDGIVTEREACPACESIESRTLFLADFGDRKISTFIHRKFKHPASLIALLSGTSYELRRCLGCTLIYQGNILSDEYTAKLYDEWLLQDDAEHELSKERLPPHQHAYFANEIATIGRLLDKPHHGLKVLDYGLGYGWWCRMAAAFGLDAYGTDLATGLVADARKRGINAIDFGELKGHRFDFINTEQVFEHLARPLEVLRFLRTLLKDKGVVKISVPESRGLEQRIPMMDWTAQRQDKRFLLPATPLIHINSFTRDSIVRMGECAGFRPISVPLRAEFSLLDASSLKSLGKAMLRPLYRRIARSPYVFLQKYE